MQPSTPPKAVAIEVVAVQPTQADSASIAYLAACDGKELQQVTYLIKVQLEALPPATSQGWALYVDHFRIPKYWAYKNGIYFNVFDPQFLHEHHGQSLRFSQKRMAGLCIIGAQDVTCDVVRKFWRDVGLNVPDLVHGGERCQAPHGAAGTPGKKCESPRDLSPLSRAQYGVRLARLRYPAMPMVAFCSGRSAALIASICVCASP